MTIVGPPPTRTPLPTLRSEPHIGEVEADSSDQKRRRGARIKPTVVEQPDLLPRQAVVPDVLGEIGLLLAALAAVLGVARLMQGGFDASVLGPIYLTVFAGSIVSGVAARRHAPLVVVAALGGLAAALTALWTIVPGATRFGIPTITTFHVIRHQIDIARAVMGSHRTPVPAVPGIVMIAAVSAGAVSVVGRIIWEATRRSKRQWPRSLALLPTFGMFCYSAPLSAEIDRPEIAVSYLVAGMFFVVTSDAGRTALVRTGIHKRGRDIAATITAPIATAATALLVFLIAAAALSGTVPVPFPWWTNTPPGTGGYVGRGGTGGTVTAESMVANLQATEVTSANVQMFQATSEEPTYWQVGNLTDFDGTKWLPGPAESQAYEGGNASSPRGPVLPTYLGDPTYFTTVRLQGFTTRLLPASPTSIAQTTDSPGPSLRISSSLGVIAPTRASDGFTYQLVAADTPIPSLTSSPSLSQIYSGLGSSKSEYLHLPSGIPAQVDSIAHEIVAGAKTPIEKVQDLVNYLSSDVFVYTLSPPPTPKGENPLLAFLVTYRQGFCQQFAGAFGVLARELGIPVRLAVGFTTGHRISAGSDVYEVTGSDAHVWPEVYLGAQLGWVSWDPTPGPATGEPKAPEIIKSRGGKGAPGGSTGYDGDVPKKGSVHPKGKTAPSATTIPPIATATTTKRHGSSSASAASGLVFGGIIVAVLVVIGLFLLRRFRRSAGGGMLAGHLSAEPDYVVLRSWLRACNALGRAGFARSQWVTPIAHAEAVRTAVNDGATIGRMKTDDASATLGAATYGYMELAQLAELACYCPGKCTSRDARHAEQEAWRIERALRTSGMLRRLPSPPPPTPTMTLVKGQR